MDVGSLHEPLTVFVNEPLHRMDHGITVQSCMPFQLVVAIALLHLPGSTGKDIKKKSPD